MSENAALYVSRIDHQAKMRKMVILKLHGITDGQISICLRERFTFILNEYYAHGPKFKIMRFFHEFSVIELRFLVLHTSVCMNTMTT